MKIIGNTVGTTLPKPNLMQTNPNEGDFVKGKDIIPTKVSQLENDSGYLTEHQDISGKLDADKLPEAVNDALTQAKASGEFKGDPFVYEDFTEEQLAALQGEPGITPQITLTNGKEADGRGNATIEVKYTVDGVTSTQSATIVDGKDGQNGQDGYTPVKGKDYFDGEDGQPGKDGEPGKDGADGVSATHSWNGTVLTITSASGTSSADLKGEKGETGAQGIQGEKGADGAKGDKGDKGDTGANGQNGADGKTPVRGVDYFTEADKDELVQLVLTELGGNPVYGYVDADNNVVVRGSLADGTYTVKYEMEDGSTVDIGNLVLGEEVHYSVTANLTNCTSNNSATQVSPGGGYSATIIANSGYELSSVKVTMGGTDITSSAYSNGVITIGSVTGNVVITASAVKEAAKTYTITNNLTNCANSNSVTVIEEGSAYNANITANDGYELDSVSATMGGSAVTVTNGVINIASVAGNIVITATAQLKNLAEPNTKNTSDWSIWCNDARSGSDGTYRRKAGTSTTNYIPFANGSTVFVKGFNIDMSSTSMETNGLVFYKADKATTVKAWGFGNYKTNNWITAISGNATDGFTFTVSNNGLAEAEYFRISSVPTGSVMDVVINVS